MIDVIFLQFLVSHLSHLSRYSFSSRSCRWHSGLREHAIFPVIDQLLLRMLPVKDLSNCSTVGTRQPLRQQQWTLSTSYPMYRDFLLRTRSSADVLPPGNRTESRLRWKNELVSGELVSGTFLPGARTDCGVGAACHTEDDVNEAAFRTPY